MITTFVVKSPIHGYWGMGYENTSTLEKSFSNETAARKHLRRCNKAYEIQRSKGATGEIQESFLREMCDRVSFSFRGPSLLVKRTVTEEPLV